MVDADTAHEKIGAWVRVTSCQREVRANGVELTRVSCRHNMGYTDRTSLHTAHDTCTTQSPWPLGLKFFVEPDRNCFSLGSDVNFALQRNLNLVRPSQLVISALRPSFVN